MSGMSRRDFIQTNAADDGASSAFRRRFRAGRIGQTSPAGQRFSNIQGFSGGFARIPTLFDELLLGVSSTTPGPDESCSGSYFLSASLPNAFLSSAWV
jgi:hypothetical protein